MTCDVWLFKNRLPIHLMDSFMQTMVVFNDVICDVLEPVSVPTIIINVPWMMMVGTETGSRSRYEANWGRRRAGASRTNFRT